VAKIDRLGEREMRATAAIAARFGDLPMRSVRPILADDGPLARHIREIRALCRALVKFQAQTDRDDRERAANQIAQREEDLHLLAEALEEDRSALLADNAALGQDERVLQHEMEALGQYARLAGRVDELVAQRVRALAASDGAAARAVETMVLYPTRQRHRDLLAQLAVASQAHASLRLMQQTNTDVLRALSTAATTTLTALRTTGLALRLMRERSEAGAQLESLASGATRWNDVLSSLDEVEARRRTLRRSAQTRRA